MKMILSVLFFCVSLSAVSQSNEPQEDRLKCLEEAVIPSAITPNGDKRNDSLSIDLKCNPSEFQFQVFNRFGELVFETDKTDFQWFGKDNDKNKLPGGVYLWKITAITDGFKGTRTSNITLMY